MPAADGRAEARLEPLVRGWLLDLQVLGRSQLTAAELPADLQRNKLQAQPEGGSR